MNGRALFMPCRRYKGADLCGCQYQGRGTCSTAPERMTSDLLSQGARKTPRPRRRASVCQDLQWSQNAQGTFQMCFSKGVKSISCVADRKRACDIYVAVRRSVFSAVREEGGILQGSSAGASSTLKLPQGRLPVPQMPQPNDSAAFGSLASYSSLGWGSYLGADAQEAFYYPDRCCCYC